LYYNLINLNYYHIKTTINNEKINIIGNDKYVIVNSFFYNYSGTNNKLTTNYNHFLIQILPIKVYNQEECCICYMNQGKLVGICGHHNVCGECISKLNKCPTCNNNILWNKLDTSIVKFILNST